MFETARAFDDLDAIAAMAGIDALTLGPTDLAQDLGVFGTPDQGRVLDEKRELILAAAQQARQDLRHAGRRAPSRPASGRTRASLLLVYGSEVDMLHTGFSRAMAEIKGARPS